MNKYENMYLADIQINNHAPVDIVTAQIEAKRKGLEEYSLTFDIKNGLVRLRPLRGKLEYNNLYKVVRGTYENN